jgi:sirohydrochlorin ferrochelatase
MKRAVIIVDHGSRQPDANRTLEDVARLVQAQTANRVYVAHMELAEPSLGQAFDAAVSDGAGFIIVVPYFLSPGRHSQEDIPRMCEEAAARHPNVRWHCAAPIGLDKMMADLVVRCISKCESSGYSCEH